MSQGGLQENGLKKKKRKRPVSNVGDAGGCQDADGNKKRTSEMGKLFPTIVVRSTL